MESRDEGLEELSPVHKYVQMVRFLHQARICIELGISIKTERLQRNNRIGSIEQGHSEEGRGERTRQYYIL